MQADTPLGQESFASITPLLSEQAQEQLTRVGHVAHVLEAIEDSELLRDRPTTILCSGCATTVSRFSEGLPPYLSWFKAECDQCEVELRRWSVIAAENAYIDQLDSAFVRELTQAYWDRHLWDGIQTAENCPRTSEFINAYGEQAASYGWDWEPSCPLCRRALSEIGVDWLDYHHWSHDPDQGICLCRSCHEAINGGESDTDLDWIARELGGKSKHDLQIVRLAAREHAIEPAVSVGEFATRLVRRYNLVQTAEEVTQILQQAKATDQLRAMLGEDLPG